LYGDVTEELYFRQPEGFTTPEKEKRVCRFHKGLYGLKQSSRLWNIEFSAFITKYGLTSTTADPCVYTRSSDNEFIIIGIWVDDGLLCTNSSTLTESIMAYLSTQFKMTSHQADCFLGLQIDRNREKRQLLLSQPQYIAGILRRFKMSTCFPVKTRAGPQSHLTTSMSPTTPEGISLMAGVPYKEAIGSLIYLMMCTRPDIAYAVGQAARFSQNRGKAHWSAVKRIFSYLPGTFNHGILFSSKGRAQLVGFTDADYAECLDSRRSTSGFLFLH
jgi:hypothetical protein